MMPATLIAMYIMAKKRKNKSPNIKQLKESIKQARDKRPEHVDWKLCAETVDSLHEWINELCLENHKLKTLLEHTIQRLQEDNAQTRQILNSLEPQFKKFSDSKDSKDH